MNVYFIARNYIKEDCWEYLIDVLKVDTVFSFIDVNEMSDSFRNQLGKKLVRYKRYLPKGGDVSAFMKKCVNNIIGGAAKIHQVDGRLQYEDLDGLSDSHYNTPVKNLRDTNDKNVMIICDMYIRELTGLISIPIFHTITRTIEYEKTPGTYSSYYVDASMETALYTYNMLKRALGTDKYRERICFIRFARNEEQLFFKTKWGYAVTKTNDGREIERSFYKFVISQLSKNFPSQFPVKEKNGKRYLTTFYDLDKIDKERADDYTEDAYDDYDPYGGYGSYENWALQEAYDGDPSNLWNID
jgi:hypothetical protein